MHKHALGDIGAMDLSEGVDDNSGIRQRLSRTGSTESTAWLQMNTGVGNNIGFHCCPDKTNSRKFTSMAPFHGGTDSPSRKSFMGLLVCFPHRPPLTWS